ncbi:MAG: FtsQ-type POTRA domain-containing protein, partial [Candidatus Cloacimonetes bacterium]|nr:FtsQ-type POTRA domain-containing protein [Candidatus Cloacimonadota bacterium]
GNSRYFATFFVFLVLAGSLVYLSKYLLRNIPLFNIRKIEIVGCNNLESLEDLAEDFIGRNIFEVPNDEIKLRYENIIRIKKVKINKVFPAKVKIEITERIGEFYVRSKEGMLFPIDGDRIVLDTNQFYIKEDLPIIVTDIPYEKINIAQKLDNELVNEVFELRTLINENIPNFDTKISEYYKKNDRLYFTDIDFGSSIYLGKDDLEDKLKRLKFVLDNRGIPENKVIDLQYKDMVVIKDI